MGKHLGEVIPIFPSGGDILVLRASGTDAYNDYILALGNGVLNSVATLLINGTGPAYDPIVLEKIKDSEGMLLQKLAHFQRLVVCWWGSMELLPLVAKHPFTGGCAKLGRFKCNNWRNQCGDGNSTPIHFHGSIRHYNVSHGKRHSPFLTATRL